MSVAALPARRIRFVRVTVGAGLAALTLMAVSLGYFAEVLRTQAAERLEGDMSSASYFLSDHAGRLFEVATLAFQRTEAATGGRDWDAVQSDPRLQRQVSAIRDALPYLDRIWLSDADGKVRLSTQSFPPPDWPVPAERQPLPKDRSIFVGPSPHDLPDGRDVFTVTRRLDGPDGTPRGTVSASIQVSYFYDYWLRLNLPPGTRITLFGQDTGRILAQAPRPAPGKPYVEMPEVTQGSLTGAEGAFRSRTDGSERRLGAYHRVGDLPLAIRLTIPTATVDVLWLDRARPYMIFALFAVVGLALVGIMAFYFVRAEARDRRTLEAEVRRRTADLATLNVLGRSLATQSSHDTVVRAVVEAGKSLTGASEVILVPVDGTPPDGDDWLVAPVAARAGGFHGHLALKGVRSPGSDERHKAIVESLASQAAASLDNANLHEAAEREINSRKVTETQQQWLIRELHHRVKNTLATVQAVMGATARASGSMEDFHHAFTGRLSSMANTHSLLTEALWQKASIRALLDKEMQPYDVPTGRIDLDGPEVELPSDMAVPFGMAMHEMATNAAKYGALSVPEGTVRISWRTEDGMLHVEWRELGGPPPEPVRKPGFGSKLIDRVLGIQLQAKIEIERPPEGIHLRAAIPVQEEEPRRVPVG